MTVSSPIAAEQAADGGGLSPGNVAPCWIWSGDAASHHKRWQMLALVVIAVVPRFHCCLGGGVEGGASPLLSAKSQFMQDLLTAGNGAQQHAN